MNCKASFLVRKERPLTSVSMLTGTKVYVSDTDYVTAWLARATVAEPIAAGKRPSFVCICYQDAIRFAVENKLAAVGVTASGHSELAVSRSIPSEQLIVNRRLKSQLQAVCTLLQSQHDTAKLSTPDGYIGFDDSVPVKSVHCLAQRAA